MEKRIYIFPKKYTPNLNDTESVRLKDRITAYLRSNSDGIAKIPISIIGAYAKARPFRERSIPSYYFNNNDG